MSNPTDSSRNPPPGRILPVARGHVSGNWYYEENPGASRLGIRVGEKLHEERSAYQKLSVYDTAFFGRVLTLDDVVMLTERDEFVYHEMLVHVPLCSIPEPQRVLIIGGGDCGALREALKHPNVEKVVQCDIDERVTRVSERFFPWVHEACADPRAELVFADGIEYVARHAASFDLIAVDSTDPVGPAAGLFVGDFYRAVLRALRPGGVMTAQTESPHWNADLVASIYREIHCFVPSRGRVCVLVADLPERVLDVGVCEPRPAARRFPRRASRVRNRASLPLLQPRPPAGCVRAAHVRSRCRLRRCRSVRALHRCAARASRPQ